MGIVGDADTAVDSVDDDEQEEAEEPPKTSEPATVTAADGDGDGDAGSEIVDVELERALELASRRRVSPPLATSGNSESQTQRASPLFDLEDDRRRKKGGR